MSILVAMMTGAAAGVLLIMLVVLALGITGEMIQPSPFIWTCEEIRCPDMVIRFGVESRAIGR